ncbi:MAG: rbsB [Sphaerisporangium sp.]|nr:rbsB [Sphaerisporangium sp.]
MLPAVVVVVLVGAAACGGGQATGGKSGKQIVIGWSVSDYANPFYGLMMKGAQTAADGQGVKVIFTDGKGDPATQTQQINGFLAQKVDGIILSAALSDPMLPVMKQVNRAGVPLVVVDRRIDPRNSGVKWSAYVGWDMVKSGKVAAEQTVKALNGKGKVAVVEGTAGAGSTIDRGNGYYTEIAKHSDIQIVYKADGNFTPTDGLKVTEAILQRFPKGELDAVYYMSDLMLDGGIQAIKNSGRLGTFKIISTDGLKAGLARVRAGEVEYDGTEFPQDEGYVGLNVMAKQLKGLPIDWENENYQGRKARVLQFNGAPWIQQDYFPVDSTNMQDPNLQGW